MARTPSASKLIRYGLWCVCNRRTSATQETMLAMTKTTGDARQLIGLADTEGTKTEATAIAGTLTKTGNVVKGLPETG